MTMSAEQIQIPIESDPLYTQALNRLQEGHWHESSEALVTLERRYPGSAELSHLRQSLALHISAEETWSSGTAGHLHSVLRLPIIRALLFANLLLYLLLAVLCVLVAQYPATL